MFIYHAFGIEFVQTCFYSSHESTVGQQGGPAKLRNRGAFKRFFELQGSVTFLRIRGSEMENLKKKKSDPDQNSRRKKKSDPGQNSWRKKKSDPGQNSWRRKKSDPDQNSWRRKKSNPDSTV